MTYSLSVTGVAAGYVTANEGFTLPDSMTFGSMTVATATPGGMQAAMSDNVPLLVKGPDGSLKLYVLDAERSTPQVPILKAL